MSHSHKNISHGESDSHEHYHKTLHLLQIELVKLQKEIIKHDKKILVILEGRDAAGKDGTIRRITKHLSPRETRVVALGKPSNRDEQTWYFQRYIPYLPANQEMVLFNRSWYNRAGVEAVMKFCTKDDLADFLHSVPGFEQMLVSSGIKILKYYLDISHKEQKQRLEDRAKDPLKQWKISPIDEVALEHWADYSQARNIMFARTHHAAAPWHVVKADDKQKARLNLMKDMLFRLDYKDKDQSLLLTDPNVVFAYEEACLENGLIAK